MSDLTQTKVVMAIIPASPNNTTATAIAVDTKGYRQAMFILAIGAHATGSPDLCKICEGDTAAVAAAGTYTIDGSDLTGATFVTAQNLLVWNIDLRGCDSSTGARRKRFMQMAITPQAASVMGAVCVLSEPEVEPRGGAERLQINATTRGGDTEVALI